MTYCHHQTAKAVMAGASSDLHFFHPAQLALRLPLWRSLSVCKVGRQTGWAKELSERLLDRISHKAILFLPADVSRPLPNGLFGFVSTL